MLAYFLSAKEELSPDVFARVIPPHENILEEEGCFSVYASGTTHLKIKSTSLTGARRQNPKSGFQRM